MATARHLLQRIARSLVVVVPLVATVIALAELGLRGLDAYAFSSTDVLEQLQDQLAADREHRLGLAIERPARRTTRWTEVVFRVDMSTDPFGRAPFIMGNAEQLGLFVPNTVPLFDDGTHGDQRAADGIWSRRFAFGGPQVLTYAFTNGEAAGEWTGLENYRLRSRVLRRQDDGRLTYPPIEQFGVHALRSDSSHPDATGHAAIARALAAEIRPPPRLEASVER